MISSHDKNSYCISANAMQLLPVMPQQLGHQFLPTPTIKRAKVILPVNVRRGSGDMIRSKLRKSACIYADICIFFLRTSAIYMRSSIISMLRYVIIFKPADVLIRFCPHETSSYLRMSTLPAENLFLKYSYIC